MVKQQLNSGQVKLGTFDFSDAGGSNFSTSSVIGVGGYVDVTGMSTTYTTGNTAEKIVVSLDGMVNSASANAGIFVRLVVNGTALKGRYMTLADANSWYVVSQTRLSGSVPANTTATIKVQICKQSGSGDVIWNRDNSNTAYLGGMQGFGIGA